MPDFPVLGHILYLLQIEWGIISGVGYIYLEWGIYIWSGVYISGAGYIISGVGYNWCGIYISGAND